MTPLNHQRKQRRNLKTRRSGRCGRMPAGMPSLGVSGSWGARGEVLQVIIGDLIMVNDGD